MSVLSCFRSDFIEYLYKCDLKINTYENVNKGIVNGYWLFFHKNNDKFVTRIRYSFNEEKKLIYIFWNELPKISPIIILYLISTFSILTQNGIYIFYPCVFFM